MSEIMDRRDRRARLGHLVRAGAAGAGAAALVNAVIYGIGRVADVSYDFTFDGGDEQTIALGNVVGGTLIAFAVGLVAAAVAVGVGRPSLRAGQVVGALLAVGTTYNSFAIDGSGALSVTLAVMHIVAGVAYVASLEVVRRRAGTSTTAPATPTPATRASAPVEVAAAGSS